MPRRTRPALATLAALAPLVAPLVVAPAAAAGMPALLCERDEVLRIVERTVRGWNRYNRILEDTVGEGPTTAANAVTCEITVTGIGYVLTDGGWVPRPTAERRRYEVRIIANRLHVQVPP